MNTLGRLAATSMPGLSTDQTAYNVNRFIAQRPSLTSRPETNEQRNCPGPTLAPEVLYASLYAERVSLAQRSGNYVRAILDHLRKPARTTRHV